MLRKPAAPSLPDVHTLAPDEAMQLCRFCFRTHSPSRTMYQLNGDNADSIGLLNWTNSTMGLLYAQLTGGEQLIASVESPHLISDSWCSDCSNQLEHAVSTATRFRAANTFWADYIRTRCLSPSLPLVDVKVEMLTVDELKEEKFDTDAIASEQDHSESMPDAPFYADADSAASAAESAADDSADDDSAESAPIVRAIVHKQRQRRTKTSPVAKTQPKPSTPRVDKTASVPPSLALQVCHICGNVYKGKMDRHMKAAHSTLVCDLCGHTFSHKMTLRRHFRDDHGFERHTCDVCGATNMTRSTWTRHMEMHRPAEDRPFACDQCGKDYRTLRVLKQHLARAHDDVEVACEECGKKFINAIRLRDHMIRHKPRTIRCPLAGCPRMFFQVKEMREHHRTVHVKDRKYVCAVCNKAFLVNAQLKKHHSLGRCPGAPGSGGPTRSRGRGPARQEQEHHQHQHQQAAAQLTPPMQQQSLQLLQQQQQLLLMQMPMTQEQQRLEHQQMAAAIAAASAKHAAESQMMLLHQQHQQHAVMFGSGAGGAGGGEGGNSTTLAAPASTATTTTQSSWSTMSPAAPTSVLTRGDGQQASVDAGTSRETVLVALSAGHPLNSYMS